MNGIALLPPNSIRMLSHRRGASAGSTWGSDVSEKWQVFEMQMRAEAAFITQPVAGGHLSSGR